MVPDGWMWLIPLAGPRLSVGRRQPPRDHGAEETLDKAIAASPIIQRLIAGAVATEPRIIRNFSYRNRRRTARAGAAPATRRAFSIRCSRRACRWRCWARESVAGKLSAALRAGTEDDPDLLAAHAKRMEIGYRTFAGDRLPLLSRGAGAPAVLPGDGGRAAARRDHQRARRGLLARRQSVPADAAELARRPRPGRPERRWRNKAATRHRCRACRHKGRSTTGR